MKTIRFTVDNNLCTSCGICKGICPKRCIEMVYRDGSYKPCIGESCVKCGMCFKVCHGKGVIRERAETITLSDLVGKYLKLYNAWSKNEIIRHKSASGGIVTTLLYLLLKRKSYDVAFVVNDYSCDSYVETQKVESKNVESIIDFHDDARMTVKSRYIPIGHGNATKYIREHPDKKVILVGTSCAIAGLQNVINISRLNRENYLFIGLFCDSVMNYNVWDYFAQKKFSRGKDLKAIHFKNKESGGWPGNIKLLFSNGEYAYYDKSFRMEIKSYLNLERCLYCVDKLNVRADISLGDNYTGIAMSPLGSNTVIVRTERGMRAWEQIHELINYREIEVDNIIKAQMLNKRLGNIVNAGFKENEIKERTGVDLDINAFGKCGHGMIDMKGYKSRLNKIHIGSNILKLNKSLIIPQTIRKVKRLIKKLLGRT